MSKLNEIVAESKWTHIWRIMIGAVAVTIIPWCVWVTTRIHAMDISVTKLEAFASAGGRFTAEHGQTLKLQLEAKATEDMNALWKELANTKSEWLKEMSALNTQIALLPQTLQIPPKWWEDYVRAEFAKTDARLTKLEAK